jgi:hypothetical protein
VIVSLLIGGVLVAALLLITVSFPSLCSKPSYASLPRVPNHAFQLVVFCGAGIGVFCFFVTLLIMSVFRPTYWRPTLLNIMIPEVIAALGTSLVTSFLCGLWRVGDVASAFYFAPLIMPCTVIALVFSVQWVSVCVGACTRVPFHWIFSFIAIVVFVKIPVNLVGSLLFAALFKAPHAKPSRVSVTVRRITRSKRHFLTSVHCWIFVSAFPVLYEGMHGFGLPMIMESGFVPGMFILVMFLTAIGSGFNSLAVRYENDGDWGSFSYMSSAGSGVVVWVVLNLWTTYVEGRDSALQTTLGPTVTGAVCSAISLGTGSVSLLASVMWIERKATQVRTVST